MTVRLKWSCSAQLIDEQGREQYIFWQDTHLEVWVCFCCLLRHLSYGVADDISKHYKFKIGGFLKDCYLLLKQCAAQN